MIGPQQTAEAYINRSKHDHNNAVMAEVILIKSCTCIHKPVHRHFLSFSTAPTAANASSSREGYCIRCSESPLTPLAPAQVFREILMANDEARTDALDFIKTKHAPTAGEVFCHTLAPTYVPSQCLKVMDDHELSKPVMHSIHMVCSVFQPCTSTHMHSCHRSYGQTTARSSRSEQRRTPG